MKKIGNFVFNETEIDGLFVIETKKYGDDRGYFFESYKKKDFDDAGLIYDFVQDNQSKSKENVLRGLHYQKVHQQAKLVRVIDGEVFDVAVDLRKNSKTYGKWFGVVLASDKGNMLMIPRGFAHGFLVLSKSATFQYKCDDYYHPEDEAGIIWNDSSLGVRWPKRDGVILSEKDQHHQRLCDSKVEL